MKFFPGIICLCVLLWSCSEPVKDKPETSQKIEVPSFDSLSGKATVEKVIILNDTEIILPKIILRDSAIATKINNHFSLETVTGYTTEEVKQQKNDSIPSGLMNSEFEVT